MRVMIAAIADHSWVENGCLSVCRTFDSINAGSFPFTLSRISVALRLLIGKTEYGEHKLEIVLADSEGRKLMNSLVNINFHSPKDSIGEAAFSFALNGQNIIFPNAGDYTVDILIDGKIEASMPLYVRENKGVTDMDIPDRI